MREIVYEYALPGFDTQAYDAAVERLISAYGEHAGKALEPGEKGRVGLNVFASAGAGLSTPPELVEAVIRALERRGYARGDIFLLGRAERQIDRKSVV